MIASVCLFDFEDDQSQSEKKLEDQKEFCRKKVFAKGNIELVRVEGSYSVPTKGYGVLWWYQLNLGPTSLYSGNTKVINSESLKYLVNRKWILSKCLPKPTSKIG